MIWNIRDLDFVHDTPIEVSSHHKRTTTRLINRVHSCDICYCKRAGVLVNDSLVLDLIDRRIEVNVRFPELHFFLANAHYWKFVRIGLVYLPE